MQCRDTLSYFTLMIFLLNLLHSFFLIYALVCVMMLGVLISVILFGVFIWNAAYILYMENPAGTHI